MKILKIIKTFFTKTKEVLPPVCKCENVIKYDCSIINASTKELAMSNLSLCVECIRIKCQEGFFVAL